MVRVLSGYNPERLPGVLEWHLRDALLAYEDHLRRQAAEDYRASVLVYAVMAPYAKKGSKLKPPRRPRILGE